MHPPGRRPGPRRRDSDRVPLFPLRASGSAPPARRQRPVRGLRPLLVRRAAARPPTPPCLTGASSAVEAAGRESDAALSGCCVDWFERPYTPTDPRRHNRSCGGVTEVVWESPRPLSSHWISPHHLEAEAGIMTFRPPRAVSAGNPSGRGSITSVTAGQGGAGPARLNPPRVPVDPFQGPCCGSGVRVERANGERGRVTVPETARASQTSPTWARMGTEQGAGWEDRREQPAL
jgi:hypothetical protein